MNQPYKATLSQHALPQFLPIYSWGCLNFTLRYSCFPLRSKWGGKGGVIWGDLEVCILETMMFEKYPSISPYTYCKNNPVIRIDPDGKKDKPFNAKTDKSITPKLGTATPIYNYDRNGNPISLASGWESAYNCHSYAWHNSKGDPNPAPGDIPQIGGVPIPKWDNNPADDILQQNGRQLKNDESNIVGDVVIYYTDTDENGQYDSGERISHSAVVKSVDSEGNTTEVIGKMGQGEISTNHPDAPDYYKTDDKRK